MRWVWESNQIQATLVGGECSHHSTIPEIVISQSHDLREIIHLWFFQFISAVTSHASRLPSTGASKRKSPSNKFLVALDQIERSIYAAQAASGSRNRHSSQRLAKIKANIKLATQQRNYLFARQALGLGLYSAVQLAKTSGRKKRSTTSTGSAVKAYMNSVKKDLGAASFDTFMSVNGDVTLMFAIDNTGSMSDEIQAAQSIAKSIVNHTRDECVDYILSPFNDPGKC